MFDVPLGVVPSPIRSYKTGIKQSINNFKFLGFVILALC